MIAVYQLKKDRDRIGKIQKATLTTDDYGIQQTHGLFGSSEWWQHIQDGKLPLHTLRGTITRVYMGSMGDWPEFEVATPEGAKESFTRECHTREQDAEYRVGRAIEIDYVWQKHKKSFASHTLDTKIVVEIRIDNSEPDGPANGSQPIRSETNRTSSAAGSRR